jgi:hypothetical protein
MWTSECDMYILSYSLHFCSLPKNFCQKSNIYLYNIGINTSGNIALLSIFVCQNDIGMCIYRNDNTISTSEE